MSEKYEKFVAALEALCKEHKVHLATSGYDGLAVWDLAEGEDPITGAGIDDETKP